MVNKIKLSSVAFVRNMNAAKENVYKAKKSSPLEVFYIVNVSPGRLCFMLSKFIKCDRISEFTNATKSIFRDKHFQE